MVKIRSNSSPWHHNHVVGFPISSNLDLIVHRTYKLIIYCINFSLPPVNYFIHQIGKSCNEGYVKVGLLSM
jgi:hypothetical protein